MKHSDKVEHGRHPATRGRLLIDLEARTYTVLGATSEEAEAHDFAGFEALRVALGVYEMHRNADVQDADQPDSSGRELAVAGTDSAYAPQAGAMTALAESLRATAMASDGASVRYAGSLPDRYVGARVTRRQAADAGPPR